MRQFSIYPAYGQRVTAALADTCIAHATACALVAVESLVEV